MNIFLNPFIAIGLPAVVTLSVFLFLAFIYPGFAPLAGRSINTIMMAIATTFAVVFVSFFIWDYTVTILDPDGTVSNWGRLTAIDYHNSWFAAVIFFGPVGLFVGFVLGFVTGHLSWGYGDPNKGKDSK